MSIKPLSTRKVRQAEGLTVSLLIPLLLVVSPIFPSPASQPESEFGEVRVGPKVAFTLEATVGGITPKERAEIVNRRIERVLTDPNLDPKSIRVESLPDGTWRVVVDGFTIVVVTERDAEAKGKSVEELAKEWALILKMGISQIKPIYAKYRRTQIKPLSEHHVLLLILQVALLLLAARTGGEVMRRLGQPPVIGQLLAGVVLGHEGLGSLFPDVWAALFPIEATQSYLLEVVAWIGVLFLLMLTGIETDINLIRRQGKSVFWLGTIGVALPFVAGILVGAFIPDPLLTSPETRWALALFLGATLSVSSVPVIAKILMDMGLLRRNIGQLTIASALVHDTVGWLILAVIAGVASAGSFNLIGFAKVCLGTVVYCVFAFTLGRRLLYAFLNWVTHNVGVEHSLLTAVTLAMLISATIAQFIGVHAVLGAFVVGVLLSEIPIVSSKVIHSVEAVTAAIFAPIFFAATGLSVNLSVLLQPNLVLLTIVITAVAVVSKILSSYWGGYLCGLDKWECLSIGLGTSVRGAMGLIAGMAGFSLGILSLDMFSIVILMSVLTTVIAPPLMQKVLAKAKVSTEERQRIQREEIHSLSFGGDLNRVLLATSGGPNALLAARLLGILSSQRKLEVTAIFVVEANRSSPRDLDGSEIQSVFEPIARELRGSKTVVHHRVVQANSPAEGILSECRRGYDLLVIGYGRKKREGSPDLGFITSEVILGSQCPAIVVRAPVEGDLSDWHLRRLLVPTTGASYSLQAAQFGILLAHASGAEVTMLYVIEEPTDSLFWFPADRELVEAMAEEVIGNVKALADTLNVPFDPFVRSAPQAAPLILQVAQELRADLIVLGSAPRPSRYLFFGPTITYVIHHAPCAIAVVKP